MALRAGYYFSASLGFKSTAVKKLTTTSQMIQFLAFMTQARNLPPLCVGQGLNQADDSSRYVAKPWSLQNCRAMRNFSCGKCPT